MKRGRLFRAITAILLAVFLGTTTACYGPFNLTRNIYKWNGQVKGTSEIQAKWMRELVFLGLVILPVYSLSLLADAVIFNSIQFWTGDNPIKASQVEDDENIRVVRMGDITATMTTAGASSRIHVAYAKDGRVYKTANIVTDGDTYQFVDEKGHTQYAAQLDDAGHVTLVDDECRSLGELPLDQLQNVNILPGLPTGIQIASK